MTTSFRGPTLVLVASSALGLACCKKNSEPAPPEPSQRERWLTTPGWKLDGFAIRETTAAGVVTTTNYPLSNFDPCALDDLEYYHADKSFTVDEGTVKCSATYPGFLTKGTWAFAANETEIVVNPNQPGATSVHVQTLSATALSTFTAPYTDANGTTSVQIKTYSAH